LKVPSYVARSIYWDDLQKKEDSRYWSYVLEDNNYEKLIVNI